MKGIVWGGVVDGCLGWNRTYFVLFGYLRGEIPNIENLSRPFDALSNYKTFTQDAPTLTTRFAVRQVLDQELRKFIILQQERIRQERFAAANPGVDIGLSAAATRQKEKEKEREAKKNAAAGVKRDFFGRIVAEEDDADGGDAGRSKKRKVVGVGEGAKIWCSFREGFSNAVKKPITWDELMAGL